MDFIRYPHWGHKCPGKFQHKILENIPYPELPDLKILKYGSFAVCEDCETSFFTEGFERFIRTTEAQKLLEQEAPLTAKQKKFLKHYFEGVAANFRKPSLV
jgi:hypothetical protein